MGHHFMNDEIFFDSVVDPLRPELLVYVPTEHGGRRLVAVEYLVFSSALGSNPVPELFGHTFHLNPAIRSEEHTSELQSLMRISYAVFCLKKKITKPLYITHYYYQ